MSQPNISQIVSDVWGDVVLGNGTRRIYFGPNWAMDVKREPLFSSPRLLYLLGDAVKYGKVAYTLGKNGRRYTAEAAYAIS